MNKYDKRHNLNLAKYERQLKVLFDAAASDAANLAPLIGKLGETPFAWKDYPLALIQMERIIKQLNRDITVSIVNGIRSEWTLANSKNNELCNVVFGSLANSLPERAARRYYSTNEQARDAFIARKEQGLGLSDRVWRYTGQFKNEIELALDTGIRSGRSADELSRDVREYLQHPDKLFRRVRDEHGQLQLSKAAAAYHPGAGVYRSSYMNARRLTATETNIAYRTSDHLRWQQMDFVVGIEIQMSNNHPVEDICDELAGRYPKDFKFTGWHPQCRCHANAILKTKEEMAKDTERILGGEEPVAGSVNTVNDVPAAFSGWVEEHADRIKAADAKGTLPYFLKDNTALLAKASPAMAAVDKRRSKSIQERAAERHAARTPEQIEQIQTTWNRRKEVNQFRGNIFARVLDDIQTKLLSREFVNIETAEELAVKASKLLSEAVGNDVSVVIATELMPLDIAKAHLTELLSVTRKYNLRQGKLSLVRLGYKPVDELEHGVTKYNLSDNTKTVSLTDIIDSRDAVNAINNSRCDKSRLPFSLASHEAGHLLFSPNTPMTNDLLILRESVIQIYHEYQKEFKSLISCSNVENAAEIMIGNYGHDVLSDFCAECFQEYRNSSHPSKYVAKIGKLLDMYFKK